MASPLFNREARRQLRDKRSDGPPPTPFSSQTPAVDDKFPVTPVKKMANTFSSREVESSLKTTLANDKPLEYKKPSNHDNPLQLSPPVKCTRKGVYTIPSSESLSKMSPSELAHVKDFTIARDSVGVVRFLEPVDVNGLDIDSLVIFTPKEIVVFPEDSNKPPVGEGLNKRALITLDDCFPLDKVTHRILTDEDSISSFVKRLQKRCKKNNSFFVGYEPMKGQWTFEVDHF
eukprot:TRINITY_DN695_c0_g1_i12.p1 TRINITY_DN695_c0_g1~~TRINITY_DN695_c0_g1_i12.p1  ORF type:complete len:231 (-),score=58.44 TRINITY_DN695_c0_g1_i12:372-1064(-)